MPTFLLECFIFIYPLPPPLGKNSSTPLRISRVFYKPFLLILLLLHSFILFNLCTNILLLCLSNNNVWSIIIRDTFFKDILSLVKLYSTPFIALIQFRSHLVLP